MNDEKVTCKYCFNFLEEIKMCKVIAIANQKGGVGKTTTCISLAAGLAQKKKKVCIIDLDPQGNATQGLGFDAEELPVTITDILNKMISKEYDLPEKYGVWYHNEGIELIPANICLSGMEMSLLAVYIGREKILKRYIDIIRQNYDYIIIDCKPSLDILTLNALVAANSVLIPVQTQFYSARGLEQLLMTISQVISDGLNPDLRVDGILFTLVNRQTCNYKQISELIKRAYGSQIKIYENFIPRSVKAEEAPAAGSSIYEFDGKDRRRKT